MPFRKAILYGIACYLLAVGLIALVNTYTAKYINIDDASYGLSINDIKPIQIDPDTLYPIKQ